MRATRKSPREASAGEEPGARWAKVIPLGIFDPFEEAKKRW